MSESRHFSSPVHEWFAYLVHELQTPLGRISKWADEMESSSPSVEVRTQLTRSIKDEADAALTMTGAVASHFALDDHKPALVRLNVDEVIQRVLPSLEATAAEKEIELDCRPMLDELHVLGERALLIGVLQNLVRNAIEYTPQFGFVGIEVAEVDAWVRVVISDSGPGIPENYVQWLFKPGFRITSAERGAWDGRGLGLAFVSRIIAMHGGRISVESEPGEGSRFVLDLPVAHELDIPN